MAGILMEERPEFFPKGLYQEVFTPAYFPKVAFPLSDSRMREIKLGHLLSLSAGIRGNNPVYVHGVASSIDPVGPDGWYGLVDEYALRIQEGNGGKGFSTRRSCCAPGVGEFYSTDYIIDVLFILWNRLGRVM